MHKLLGDWATDETSTAWGGDETNVNGATLAMDLAGDGMGLAELVAPVAATDGDDRQLGQDDGTADGGGDFLGALDAKADVAVLVTDGDNGLVHRVKLFSTFKSHTLKRVR